VQGASNGRSVYTRVIEHLPTFRGAELVFLQRDVDVVMVAMTLFPVEVMEPLTGIAEIVSTSFLRWRYASALLRGPDLSFVTFILDY